MMTFTQTYSTSLITSLIHHPIMRITSALIAATAITCGLFLLMNMLIAQKNISVPSVIEDTYIPINPDQTITPPPLGPVKPKPPEKFELPLTKGEIPIVTVKPTPPVTSDEDWSNTPYRPSVGTPDPTFNDGDMLLISQIPPVYPGPLVRRGVEGYVVVEFTVTETGAVINPTVLETSNRSFNKSALTAIGNFKYKPRVIDGKTQSVSGVIYKFTFTLEK